MGHSWFQTNDLQRSLRMILPMEHAALIKRRLDLEASKPKAARAFKLLIHDAAACVTFRASGFRFRAQAIPLTATSRQISRTLTLKGVCMNLSPFTWRIQTLQPTCFGFSQGPIGSTCGPKNLPFFSGIAYRSHKKDP